MESMTQRSAMSYGNFSNRIMGNNDTRPVAGEWCTFLHFSDRSVGKVESVSADGKSCVVREYDTVADIPEGKTLPHGHQNWKHEASDRTMTLVWRKGAWRTVSVEYMFVDAFADKLVEKHGSEFFGIILRKHYPNILERVYAGHILPSREVKGITKACKTYGKVSVIFGICDYYHDWSF